MRGGGVWALITMAVSPENLMRDCRRVALQQRASISARVGGPFIDLIEITQEITGSPTLCDSTVTMMQPADLWNRNDLALRRRFDLSWK
jgi:hypothetical protein